MPELRELTTDSLDELKALFRSVFTREPWNEDWSDDRQLDDYFLDLTHTRTPVILGLYEDGALAGFCVGSIKHWYGGTEYFIEELCIRTEQQGRGLGRKFFELIGEYLKGRGIMQIFLFTSRDVPAYGFYKKLGFEEQPHLTAFRKDL